MNEPRVFVPLLALVPLLGACAYGTQRATGAFLVPFDDSTYTLAAVDPRSVEREVVVRELMTKGFDVLRPEAAGALEDRRVPPRSILWVTCVYRGHVAADAMGSTAADVECSARDFSDDREVYIGQGQHVAMTVAGDIRDATRDALAKLPRRMRRARELSLEEVSEAFEIARPGDPRWQPSRGIADLELVGAATGFWVSPEGHAVTNAHVVTDCTEVRQRDSHAELQIVRIDSQNDLALLQGPGPVSPAFLRQGRSVRAGENIVVVGYPLPGLLASEAIVTTGTVSALTGPANDSRLLQITAPVQAGNSGGPLLDGAGNVVGVVVAKLDALRVARITGDIPQNVNFAITAGVLQAFLDASEVDYQLRASSTPRDVPDIAAEAKTFTIAINAGNSWPHSGA